MFSDQKVNMIGIICQNGDQKSNNNKLKLYLKIQN